MEKKRSHQALHQETSQKETKLDQDVQCYHVDGLGDLERDPSRPQAATDPKPTARP